MLYNFCSKCGDRYLPEQDGHKFVCASCGFVIYLNSKPTASALVVDGNQVLLGKRLHEPEKGKWDVIGGFLEYGEHPEIGAIREAKEETGLDVEVQNLLGIFMDEYGEEKYATLNICYIVKVVGGKALAGDDIGSLEWFDANALPEDIAFQNGREMLKAWLASRG